MNTANLVSYHVDTDWNDYYHTDDIFTNRLVVINRQEYWLLGIDSPNYKRTCYVLTDGENVYYEPTDDTTLWVSKSDYADMTALIKRGKIC